MRQFLRRGWYQARLPGHLSMVIRSSPRALRAALAPTAAVGLLAGTLLASPPASAAASSTYAVTEMLLGNGQLASSIADEAADPATNTLYAATIFGVDVIDGATNSVAAQVSLTNGSSVITVDTASGTAYAFNEFGPPTCSVIDGATNSVTATITMPTGFGAGGAAVNPVTHMVYVTDYAHGTVVVIDGSTDEVAATIPLADPAVDPTPNPRGIWVNSASNTIYVADHIGNQVAVIDGATNTVTGRIALPAGSAPWGVTGDPSTGTVYVADDGINMISAIDTPSDSVSALGSGIVRPQGLALDSGTGTLYATSPIGSVGGLGTTFVIDTASGVTTTQIPRGGLSAAVLPAAGGGSAYVAASLSHQITVLTPSTVNTMSPIIVTGPSLTFTVGQAYQSQIVASATPAATFSATGLPPGITLSPSGLLSGTPAAGTGGTVYVVTVTAANGVAPSASITVSIIIQQAPVITSANQVTFQTGVAGSFTLTAAGYPAPTFAETGTLPAGVTLSTGGVLSGTPEAGTGGSYPITVSASNGIAPDDSFPFTLTVDQPPAITSASQATFEAGAASSFTVTATGYPAPVFAESGALPAGVTLQPTGVLSGTPAAGTSGIYSIQIAASNAVATVTQSFTLTVSAVGPSYTPLDPVRVLDTRNGNDGHTTPAGPGGMITLQVAGLGGVPPSGATAVVLNVTATDPTASSFVTVYPDGQPRPLSSSLNFSAGETIANLVVVPLGSDGKVDFYNHAGSVNLVADLTGYYSPNLAGSFFDGLSPVRVLDTRNGTGGFSSPVGPGGMITLQVTGKDGVPATGVTAVVLNVTATGPTASSFVTVFPDGQPRPFVSNLNFTPAETVPNLVIVPVLDGKVDFYNDAGSVNLVADLTGYFSTAVGGSTFSSLSPVRVLDTRNGTGGYTTPVGPGGMISLQVTGMAGVPVTGVTAVVLNVTATGPTASSYVTVYPDGQTRPTASELNFVPGETIPNLVIVPVGADGEIDFYNHAGSVDLVADLAGYFTN